MLLVASLALSLNLAPLRPPPATRCASIRCAEAATEEAAVATTIEYGGIPHVGVIIGDAEEAREFYTGVLGMVDVTDEEDLEHPGAAMRVGEQVSVPLGARLEAAEMRSVRGRKRGDSE